MSILSNSRFYKINMSILQNKHVDFTKSTFWMLILQNRHVDFVKSTFDKIDITYTLQNAH